MFLLLLNVFFCFLAPSPLVKATTMQLNQQSEVVESNDKEGKTEERADDSLGNVLFGSGVGLIAVGGIGAGVVTYNNNKPKNVPSNKKEKPYNENDIDK